MTRLGRAVALVVLLPFVVLAAAAVPAVAGEQPADTGDGAGVEADIDADGNRLAIRSIDATDPAEVVVEFLYDGPGEVTDLQVVEAGEAVEFSAPEAISDPRGTVVVIDASESMTEGAAFEHTLDAVRELIDADPAGQFGLVTFNDRATVVERLSRDRQALEAAIERMGVGPGSALYDGVKEAANLLRGHAVTPVIMVVTDGHDEDSTIELAAAQALVDDVGAVVQVVGIDTGDLRSGELAELAERTGGALTSLTDVTELDDALADAAADSAARFRTRITSASDGSTLTDLALTIGDLTSRAQYEPGVTLGTPLEVTPPPAVTNHGIDTFEGPVWLVVAIVLVLIAVALATFSLVSIFVTDRRSLEAALRPYEGVRSAPSSSSGRGVLRSSLVRRAVDLTGEIAERRGLLRSAEAALERANLPLRAAEAMFAGVVVAGAIGFLVLALSRNLLAAVLVTAVALAAPPTTVNFLAGRRRRQFLAQLPDMLQLLASTLRAGYSMLQGVEATAQEVGEPMGRELRRVLAEARLGLPLESALEGVAERMRSRDFEWAVMAIRIQREVGGNLAELLVTVADTMTQRERLRRDVRSLTAEGRISAIVLGMLPPFLGVVMWTINPDYVGRLFEGTAGPIMLVSSVVWAVIGFVWMMRTIDIEV